MRAVRMEMCMMCGSARFSANQPHEKRPAYAFQPYGCFAEKRAEPHIMHISIRTARTVISSFSCGLNTLSCGISIAFYRRFVK